MLQAGGNADALQEKSKDAKKKITETEEREQAVIKQRDNILKSMGNLVHDSVPISQDEVGAARMCHTCGLLSVRSVASECGVSCLP